METTRDGIAPTNKEEATYSIIAYPAHTLVGEKRNMILNNFLKSLYRDNYMFALIFKDDYYKYYHKYIESLLNRPDTMARFCVLSDDPDVIMGWSLMERDILHYVFVKGAYRNKGMGRSLVPTPINWFTHLTKAGFDLWHNKVPKAHFNPFL